MHIEPIHIPNDGILEATREHGELLIPITHVCAWLGIADPDGQVKRVNAHPFLGPIRVVIAVQVPDSQPRSMICLRPFDCLIWLANIAKRSRSDKDFARQIKLANALRTAALSEIARAQDADPMLVKRVALLEEKVRRQDDYQDKQRLAAEAKKAVADVDRALAQLDEDTKSRQGLLDV